MLRITKRYHCPYCQELVVQWTNSVGPNFCPRCHRLFHLQQKMTRELPPYALGVLAVLAFNVHLYV